MPKIAIDPAKAIDYIQFIFIDLFCGAGGVTIGVDDAGNETFPEDVITFLKSVGIRLSNKDLPSFKICKVVACINHDPIAIKSHWCNHPDVEHFEEDIRLLNPFGRLKRLIDLYRAFYPQAKIVLWASLECTNFSKAKGGEGRDQDSRTLAYELYRYIKSLDPDYVLIENVVEFMAWGPMAPRVGKTPEGYPFSVLKIKSKKGKIISIGPSMVPESSKNGQDWNAWREVVNSFGYHDAWKQVNAADHGAMTSRNRLFGCFAKEGLPIVWPEATHAKKPKQTAMVKPMKKWRAVKHALDFQDEGKTIFNRVKCVPKVKITKDGYQYSVLNWKNFKKNGTFGPVSFPISSKTMQRLFMGCVKHVAGGKDKFISRYNGGNPDHRNHSVNEPAGAITTSNRLALIHADKFMTKFYSGKPEHKSASVEDPSPSITTFGGGGLVFIEKAFGGKPEDKSSSIESPLGTITTIPNQNRVIFVDQRNGQGEDRSRSIDDPAKTLTQTGGNQQLTFIAKYNGVNGGKHHNTDSVEAPVGSLRTGDGHAKVTAFISPYNSNKSENEGGGNNGRSIEDPAPVIATRNQPALVQAEHFIQKYYTSGGQHNSIEDPAATVRTKDTLSKISVFPMNNNNHQSIEDHAATIMPKDKNSLVTAVPFRDYNQHQSVDVPAGTIMPNDKHRLVTAEKFVMPGGYNNEPKSIEEPAPTITASRHHHYIVDPSWFNESARSVDEPCYVIVARHDKAPLYMITCTEGPLAVPVYEGDCEWTIKLKEFMALYNICDIKMRMLKVPELKKIQGFPEEYILLGDQSDQKKFIGNSVCPVVPKRWMRAFSMRLMDTRPQTLKLKFAA